MTDTSPIRPKLVCCSLAGCVHVAGAANFAALAERRGVTVSFLGAAVQVSDLIRHVVLERPEVIGVSYRLSEEACRAVLERLKKGLEEVGYGGKLIFAGTRGNVEIAKRQKFFDAFFEGGEKSEQIAAILDWICGAELQSSTLPRQRQRPPFQVSLDHLPMMGRNAQRMPLIRHHFGLSSLRETEAGIQELAESEVLDVISIAPDQNAQEFLFRPDRIDSRLDGAGGVPIRSALDLERLAVAAQRGNWPYLRIYAGTQDLLQWAELAVRTIDNAWGTIPLFWSSELDGRSRRGLESAIRENMDVIRFYAEIGKPVEVNEAHQWSLREAPDAVAVAVAFIAAYVAKKLGVRKFVCQLMFNTPDFTSPVNDLGKMLAKLLLISSLVDGRFSVYRQVRCGLSHFSPDMDIAKGQLGMTTALMSAFNPHILHVVSFTEGSHAAGPVEIAESVKISLGALSNASKGMPWPLADTSVHERACRIVVEAVTLLGAIQLLGAGMGSDDPLADPQVLAQSVRVGLLDAPHLRGQPAAKGAIRTVAFQGGCHTAGEGGGPVAEVDRLTGISGAMGASITQISALEPDIEDVRKAIDCVVCQGALDKSLRDGTPIAGLLEHALLLRG